MKHASLSLSLAKQKMIIEVTESDTSRSRLSSLSIGCFLKPLIKYLLAASFRLSTKKFLQTVECGIPCEEVGP